MGISSGAKLAVALTMVVFLNRGLITGSLTLILAAFAGAMAAMLFVLAVARRVQQMSILVICGVMIGYICSAVTDIVVAFAQDSNIVNLHNWSMGSFSGMTGAMSPRRRPSFCPAWPPRFCSPSRWPPTSWAKATPPASACRCGRFPWRLCCCQAAGGLRQRLPDRSPSSALRCRIW